MYVVWPLARLWAKAGPTHLGAAVHVIGTGDRVDIATQRDGVDDDVHNLDVNAVPPRWHPLDAARPVAKSLVAQDQPSQRSP